ncbi:hypothetical protein ACFFQF_12095 [Haladaptatus pallidirubidus]|uniref:Uncharacterized protein n=1 Tax=Haladaptatus pallidirubidus TaxID=1008152 RepID=A0AAV3UFR5_9EURY|nr:hypothetical protein [Haladaptatus pallidirubidus]
MGIPKVLLFALYVAIFGIMSWFVIDIFAPNPTRMGVIGMFSVAVGVGGAYYRTYLAD